MRRESRLAYDIPSISRAVGRLSMTFKKYDVGSPWKSSEETPGTGSCWFVSSTLGSSESDDHLRFLVTCNHCIESTNVDTGVLIEMSDKQRTTFRAFLVAAFPTIDATILQIDPQVQLKNITPLTMGDDRPLRVGDEIQVYGYPLEEREVKVSTSRITGRENGLMQVDGSINFGNSGGPIVKDGLVVGWISMGIADANAISFAQPISLLRVALEGVHPRDLDFLPLIAGRCTLGIIYFSNNLARLLSYGAREERCDQGKNNCACISGPVIQYVSLYSSLRGTMEPGDVLCSVVLTLLDGEKHYSLVSNDGEVTLPWCETPLSFDTALLYAIPGTDILVRFWSKRKSKLIQMNVPRVDANVNGFFQPYHPFESTQFEAFAGMVVCQADSDVLLAFPAIPKSLDFEQLETPSLIITDILSDSAFAPISSFRNPALMKGDTIDTVNGYKVRTLEEYRNALLHPIEGKYLSVETRDRKGKIVSMREVLEKEPAFVDGFYYPPSFAFRYFFGMRS